MPNALDFLLNLAPEKRDEILAVVTPLVETAEAVLGPRTGAAKRRMVIAAVREAIPALNDNEVPDWLEDFAIGAVVDLVVGVLKSKGLGRPARELSDGGPRAVPGRVAVDIAPGR